MHHRHRRRGLSLLEVLIALTIFLIALIALGQLLSLSGEMATEAHWQAEAVRLCQAQLANVSAGVVPLQAQSDAPLDEDSDWLWSLECEADDIPNLWRIHVTVSRQRPDGSRIECTLHQLVVDPAQRGTLTTTAASSSTTTTATSGSSSSSGSSGSGSSGSGSSGSSGSGSSGSSGGSSSQGSGSGSSGGSSKGGKQ